MWRSGCYSYRVASAVTLVAFSVSCTTWKSPQLAPEQVIASKRPDHVRVLQSSGAQLELWNPRISNDSLVGRLARADSTRLDGMPLADIKQLQVRAVSAGKTVLLVTGIGVAVLLVGAATSEDDYFNGGGTDTTSCPLVYSWDGHQWRLDSGTFGGAIMPALTRTDVDNLLHATAARDTLRLRVTNQARETDYLDYLAVLAVDHRPGSAVVPDGEGRLQSFVAPEAPAGAVDFGRRDAIARVTRSDGWAWESIPTGRDSSRAADVRDGIELSFRRPPAATTARLLVDASTSAWAQFMMKRFVALHGTATQAWYDSVAADRRLAQRIGAMMAREVYLSVAVKVDGRWERQGLVREGGPEISKQQIVPLDLSRVTGDTVTVRLESAPSLWLLDRVAIDYSAPESFASREILPSRAIDHDGRDVRGLIGAADEREYVMERGDRAEVTFAVPPVPPGHARSYVLVTRGWYRIDVPATGEPQFALLERALAEPVAASRLITGDLGRAIAALNRE
ncbi:MAG TPA: hypothetical protein VFU40_03665 [Gemmatimonadales bacterium]|nr:hypothetical protein [Gemmatimonadales bacterium]